MKKMSVNPMSVPRPPVGASRGALVEGSLRRLYISGQIPIDTEGNIPHTFEGQARLAWAHILSVLEEDNMDLSNLVKVITYLSDRKYGDENRRVRAEILGSHAPALTVVIAGIFDERWLLEIEAYAED